MRTFQSFVVVCTHLAASCESFYSARSHPGGGSRVTRQNFGCSISIMLLYIAPLKIYLVDIYRLVKTAFSTTNRSATSLKTILESPTIPKVIFDVRNDSVLLQLLQVVRIACSGRYWILSACKCLSLFLPLKKLVPIVYTAQVKERTRTNERPKKKWHVRP